MKNFDTLLEVLQDLAKKDFEIKISTLSFSEKVEKQKELFEDFFKSIDYRAIYSCLYKDQRIFNICVLSLRINEVLYNITLLEKWIVLQDFTNNKTQIIYNTNIEYCLIDFCNFLIKEKKSIV